MTWLLNNGVANGLATLILVTVLTAPVQAEVVTLPDEAADPVTLSLIDNSLTESRPAELFEVFLGSDDPCCTGRLPISGRYAQTEDVLAFFPAFGFEPGQDYVVRIRTADDDALFPFRITSSIEAIPAAVTELYPSGGALPENTLRFYIHFSVPMRPHVAFDYIRLSDASGTVDEAAFMRFAQELWNEDRTRLTVLIDPGRIKREVATNLELGPALLAGGQYALTVEGGWPSADGATVLSAFTRTFQVSDPLRTRPDASLWNANAPCVGTVEPLTIAFDRPFDRHLLMQALRVETEEGAAIYGMIEIADAEHQWSFTPHQPWSLEDLNLVANPTLEDVAGNNFRDLLDHVAGSSDLAPSATNRQISIQDCAG